MRCGGGSRAAHLVLVVDIGGGAAPAAAIGARRTETAYPRVIHYSNDADVVLG
jgi:hypothetical protein